jgi:hypothetical protein
MSHPGKPLTTCFTEIWQTLKAADTDLQAHKNAIQALLTKRPDLAESLNAYLAVARQDRALADSIKKKYSLILETYVRTLPESEQAIGQELSETLE